MKIFMQIFMHINVKMRTIIGILTFMSRQNRILSLSETEKKVEFRIFFILMGMYNAELRMKIFMPAGSGVLSCYVK